MSLMTLLDGETVLYGHQVGRRRIASSCFWPGVIACFLGVLHHIIKCMIISIVLCYSTFVEKVYYTAH
jgi:hypothetical protein